MVDIKTIRDIDYAVFDGSRIHVDPLMHKENYFYSILPLKSDQNKRKFQGNNHWLALHVWKMIVFLNYIINPS